VYAWFSSRGDVATRRQRMLVGASLGAAAGVFAVVMVLAIRAFRGGQLVIPLVPVAFEIGSGAVCGIIAIPAAVRLLTVPEALPTIDVPRTRAGGSVPGWRLGTDEEASRQPRPA